MTNNWLAIVGLIAALTANILVLLDAHALLSLSFAALALSTSATMIMRVLGLMSRPDGDK